MRDVNYGYLIRYIHANGASFFFICMYAHIGKALYYGSYKSPRVLVWVIGVIIFIVTMATAFLGKKTQHCPKSIIKNKSFPGGRHLALASGSKKRISYLENVTYPLFRNSLSFNLKPFHRSIHTSSYLLSGKGPTFNISPHQDISNPEEIFKDLNIKLENYWENLNTIETRDSIKETVKNKSGIYIIINKITRNYYIGSAITNKLNTRFNNHCYHTNNGNKRIKKSINQYGLNNFIFGILEYYPEIINKNNNIELLNLEQTYISLMAPVYNVLTEAGNSFGYKHMDETKLKMKSLFTKERRELLAELQRNRKGKWSLESKEKIRQSNLNRSSDWISDKGRAKISAIHSKTIYLKDLYTNEYICEFKNIPKMHNYICCSEKTIRRALKIERISIPTVYVPYLNNELINKFTNVKENNPILINCDLKSSVTSQIYSKIYIITRKP